MGRYPPASSGSTPRTRPRHAVVVGTGWLPISDWVSLIGYSIVRSCGMHMDRDLNASRVILSLGQQALASA